MTLPLTAGLESPNGQGSCCLLQAPSAPPAAVGNAGLVPFPLWAPGPTGPDVHWAVGVSQHAGKLKEM